MKDKKPATQTLMISNEITQLRRWASERYNAEVLNRPDDNIYKEILKTTWLQIIEKIDEMIINY